MKLYYCESYQKFQVFDYIKEKWYKKGKYIPRKEKEIRICEDSKKFLVYANSKKEAEEKYYKNFTKEKIDLSFNYNHYDYDKNYKIFLDKLEKETFLYIEEYKNNETLTALKYHMNSDDYLLYCKEILLDNNIKSMI